MWRHVAAAWSAFCPSNSWNTDWARTASAEPFSGFDHVCHRAVLIGIRHETERALREPFALLRGIVVHELVQHRHAVSKQANSADGPPLDYDHVRAASRVYARIRSAFEDAVRNEMRRCVLLRRQMKAAGLPDSSCNGPNSPLVKCVGTWVTPGVVTVIATPDLVQQQVLPLRPLANVATTALATRRLCPRDDLAPPDHPRRVTAQVYVAPSEAGDAFGVTIVTGGDSERDLHALHSMDCAGRVALSRTDPTFVGATAHSALQAILTALVHALDLLAASGGPAHIVLRVGDAEAAAVVAGAWDPPREALPLHSRVVRLMHEARYARGLLCVAGFDPLGPYFWGMRAEALAEYAAARGAWGNLPPTLANAVVRAPDIPPWSDDPDCPVCLEVYADLWPSPARRSRCPSNRWACYTHAVCRSCDWVIQRSPQGARCPLCRADRRVVLSL